MAVLPDEVTRLFWDIDVTTLDLSRHSDYVIERLMSRGTWAAMRWLRATYSAVIMVDFLRRKGDRLPPRERAYWALICGVSLSIEPGGGRPTWA
jgi:squalene cyclase